MRKGGGCMGIDLNQMPKLGFGLMRLPEKDGKIDIEHHIHFLTKVES